MARKKGMDTKLLGRGATLGVVVKRGANDALGVLRDERAAGDAVVVHLDLLVRCLDIVSLKRRPANEQRVSRWDG